MISKMTSLIISPMNFIDDLAFIEKDWCDSTMGEIVLHVGLSLLASLIVICTSTPGSFLFFALILPLLFSRALQLGLDALYVTCRMGWATNIGSGRPPMGIFLPKLLRIGDCLGSSLSSLLFLFLVTSPTSSATSVPVLPPPSLGRSQSVYQTIFYPLWLVTGVEIGTIITAALAHLCLGGVLLTYESPEVGLGDPLFTTTTTNNNTNTTNTTGATTTNNNNSNNTTNTMNTTGATIAPTAATTAATTQNTTTTPGIITTHTFTYSSSRLRTIITSLGMRIIFVIANLMTVPLGIKLDNYSSVRGWNPVLSIGWALVCISGVVSVWMLLAYHIESFFGRPESSSSSFLLHRRTGGGGGRAFSTQRQFQSSPPTPLLLRRRPEQRNSSRLSLRNRDTRPSFYYSSSPAGIAVASSKFWVTHLIVFISGVFFVCGVVMLLQAKKELELAEIRMMSSGTQQPPQPSFPSSSSSSSSSSLLLPSASSEAGVFRVSDSGAFNILLPWIVCCVLILPMVWILCGSSEYSIKHWSHVYCTTVLQIPSPTSRSLIRTAFIAAANAQRQRQLNSSLIRPFGPVLPPPDVLIRIGDNLYRRVKEGVDDLAALEAQGPFRNSSNNNNSSRSSSNSYRDKRKTSRIRSKEINGINVSAATSATTSSTTHAPSSRPINNNRNRVSRTSSSSITSTGNSNYHLHPPYRWRRRGAHEEESHVRRHMSVHRRLRPSKTLNESTRTAASPPPHTSTTTTTTITTTTTTIRTSSEDTHKEHMLVASTQGEETKERNDSEELPGAIGAGGGSGGKEGRMTGMTSASTIPFDHTSEQVLPPTSLPLPQLPSPSFSFPPSLYYVHQHSRRSRLRQMSVSAPPCSSFPSSSCSHPSSNSSSINNTCLRFGANTHTNNDLTITPTQEEQSNNDKYPSSSPSSSVSTTRSNASISSSSSSSSSSTSGNLCAICYTRDANAVLGECFHGGICLTCGKRLQSSSLPAQQKCPFCRRFIDHVLRILPISQQTSVVVRVITEEEEQEVEEEVEPHVEDQGRGEGGEEEGGVAATTTIVSGTEAQGEETITPAS